MVVGDHHVGGLVEGFGEPGGHRGGPAGPGGALRIGLQQEAAEPEVRAVAQQVLGDRGGEHRDEGAVGVLLHRRAVGDGARGVVLGRPVTGHMGHASSFS